MSLGDILVVVSIQLAALLAPIAIGFSGVISGGVAGLTSILAWALVGVPASYAFVDARNAYTASSARSRYAAAQVRPIRT